MALQDGFLHKAPPFLHGRYGESTSRKTSPSKEAAHLLFWTVGAQPHKSHWASPADSTYGENGIAPGDWRPLTAQCKKILFIKMLIRSTLFPINQIKWPQQFQPFLRLERLGNGFFFLSFFPHVIQVMMVFGVSLPSHKSQRGQINSSLQKKIHQGAIDFINCSDGNLTGHLFHKHSSGSKVGTTMWGNFFIFYMDVIFWKLLAIPSKLRTVVPMSLGIL